jgi:hypothetical protein
VISHAGPCIATAQTRQPRRDLTSGLWLMLVGLARVGDGAGATVEVADKTDTGETALGSRQRGLLQRLVFGTVSGGLVLSRRSATYWSCADTTRYAKRNAGRGIRAPPGPLAPSLAQHAGSRSVRASASTWTIASPASPKRRLILTVLVCGRGTARHSPALSRPRSRVTA